MRRALPFVLIAVAAVAACRIDITLPERAPTYWCYSDSLKAVRDSFPLCLPDSTQGLP